ncbi:ABC transporter substrate-binding protein [Paenibacillus cymbidii]|uniref:ABC transporter substrate-binding protein n=1 Tax=Paenibacillus cymbidii TaxID=1639034 RepID=UPI0010801640|nr:ABC transporter substrate-binding protein [Paenibacillus cymbidii]
MARKAGKRMGMAGALIVALPLALAGCGGGSSSDGKSPAATGAASTAPTTAPSATASAQPLKPVKLTWYYLGDNTGDYQQVYDAANKIIQAKINATVDFQPMSNADFKAKMPLKVAAGEKFDLTYTADYIFTYRDNVAKGALLPLDDLIAKYAPQTKKLISDNIWAAAKVNGKIYAVPNSQVQSRQKALLFNKALVDKYNLKDKIFAVKKMADLTPILDVIKKNEPGIYPTFISPGYAGYDVPSKEQYNEQIVLRVPVGVNYDLKVVDMTQGQFKELALADYKLAREWQKAGYFHPDAALAKDLSAEQKAGKFFVHADNYKPGVEADTKNKWGFDTYAVPMSFPVLSTGSINAALTAVSRTSENPERAMMLIELMNTDKELLNLLTFGLEGVDYKKTGDNSIEVIAKPAYSGKAWAIGNQFLAYLLPGQAADVWEQTKKLNASAVPAPTIGFAFDNTKVKTEIANMTTVLDKYDKIFNFGMADDYAATFEQEIKDLNAAGMQNYIKELQSQIDAWKATK